jgi:hypothetical protein
MIRPNINKNQRSLLAFISFNLGWWVCMIGAKFGWPLAGPIYCVFALSLHLWVFPNPRAELAFVLIMTLIGSILDSALMYFGLFQFRPIALDMAPPWLIAMWALFAMTMETSNRLRGRIWLLMLMSAVTAPLSYFAGEILDKILYARPLWMSLGIHGLIWAFLMPGLYEIRDWCHRNFR